MQEKRGCVPSLSAAAVSNQRQRLLDKLSAFDTSCQRLKCLLSEQQQSLSHMADLEQAETVTSDTTNDNDNNNNTKINVYLTFHLDRSLDECRPVPRSDC